MKPMYSAISLVNFFIAACFGLLLRAAFVYPEVNAYFTYSNVLHAHSHLAMLGWLYMLVFVLFVHFFSIQTTKEQRFYTRLFWFTQLAVIGMTLTFPFQGYAAPSIVFSTLHLLCSYAFGYHLWKYNTIENPQTRRLLKTAIICLFVSTLGAWCLGPIGGIVGKTSVYFQLCIQFFLHFQLNGWFLTAFITLFFHYFLGTKSLPYFTSFYWLWSLSIALTFGLVLAWYLDAPQFFTINTMGVIAQCFAFGIFGYSLWKKIQLKQVFQFSQLWLLLACSSLVLRILVQLSTVIETIATSTQAIHSWIIGFIHLNMLGIMTGFGIWLLIQLNQIRVNGVVKLATICLLSAFASTQLVLVLQGLTLVTGASFIFQGNTWLFACSIGFPLGIFLLLCTNVLQSKR
ncbi:hypothetical protein [Myroides sp. DW712]|uniref:hypothetical protein n=1 Tax=Myroides sp. DW712 TaxID=3389800 RepID=UPI00397E7D93